MVENVTPPEAWAALRADPAARLVDVRTNAEWAYVGLPDVAATGQEAVGSMGTDTPISALSSRSKLLYTYFKQNFAQVTNPPIDPIREELVMSLVSFIGPRPNLLDLEGTSRKKRLEVRQPILTNEDLEKIRNIGHLEDTFDTKTLDITYASEHGAPGMDAALAVSAASASANVCAVSRVR